MPAKLYYVNYNNGNKGKRHSCTTKTVIISFTIWGSKIALERYQNHKNYILCTIVFPQTNGRWSSLYEY
jgi:hypothetical protein